MGLMGKHKRCFKLRSTVRGLYAITNRIQRQFRLDQCQIRAAHIVIEDSSMYLRGLLLYTFWFEGPRISKECINDRYESKK